mmetsp:Transcript_26620/g.48783  ORF Transcript_26620/g.48783 Transcript_26620/m.48783 type:complete len:367 (-) Transcript_26620:24-1124(-)
MMAYTSWYLLLTALTGSLGAVPKQQCRGDDVLPSLLQLQSDLDRLEEDYRVVSEEAWVHGVHTLPFEGQRRVYMDMGAEWANTLRLFKDIVPADYLANTRWEIYAFEANPVIQPYVEQFVSHLNGNATKPLLTVPPALTATRLARYAWDFDCWSHDMRAMHSCMARVFAHQLQALQADPRLNSTDLVTRRLSEAKARVSANAKSDRFTFIPAAIGAETGWTTLRISDHEAFPAPAGGISDGYMQLAGNTTKVIKADVVSWLIDNFSEEDFIVVKMDAGEGQFEVLEALMLRNKLNLIDELAYNCVPTVSRRWRHPGAKLQSCEDVRRELAAHETFRWEEGGGYYGWDSYSTPGRYKPVDPRGLSHS